jgi:hypothetical protein
MTTVAPTFSSVFDERATLKPRSRNDRPTSPASPRRLPPLKTLTVT